MAGPSSKFKLCVADVGEPFEPYSVSVDLSGVEPSAVAAICAQALRNAEEMYRNHPWGGLTPPNALAIGWGG